jgi:surfeit locus 1 family protein
MLRKFMTPRWIFTTLLALAGVAVLIRLGIWQLDRLEWRREFNTRVVAQINAPALDLNNEQPSAETLYEMEYRQVQVRGVYDFSQEVLLRNQVWDNQLGYRVLTPLHVSGSNAWILVDRAGFPMIQPSRNSARNIRSQAKCWSAACCAAPRKSRILAVYPIRRFRRAKPAWTPGT